MLNANNVPHEGREYEKIEALEPGTYPARLVRVVNMGLQTQRPFQGEEKAPKMDLHLTYELTDEFLRTEEGEEDKTKPRWVSERIPFNSLDSDLAKSTKRYYALDPNEEYDGDWEKLIGTPCMINITQNPGKGKNKDRIFNNVDGVSSMRPKEAAKAPELVNDPVVFDFYNPDLELFGTFHQKLQDSIKESLDFEGSDLEKMLEGQGKSSDKKEKKSKPEAEDEEDW